jgi:hypothetical protein
VRPTRKKLLALSAAVSLGLAACGGGGDIQPAVTGEPAPLDQEPAETTELDETETETEAETASADDPAAVLRATLTATLQEHVYLTGLALASVVEDGEDDPTTQAALAAVEDNTAALGEALATVPGLDDTDALLQVWRDHVDALVDHAAGRDAEDDLEAFHDELSALLEEATDGELRADDLHGELETHTTLVTDAVDALADGDTEGLALLRDAARHADDLALALAEGFVAAEPEAIEGSATSEPARTRAALTSRLQEQAYLAVLTAQQVVRSGSTTDPAVQAAVTLQERGAEDLANLVGTDARRAFLDAWRPHVAAIIDYAEARSGGDDDAAQAARTELDATADEVAALLGEQTGTTVEVGAHVDGLTGAIDALADDDPAAFTETRAAAQAMVDLASALAPALAAGGDEDGETGTGTGVDATTGPDVAGDGTAGAGTPATEDPTGDGDSLIGGGTTDVTEPPSSPAESDGPTAEGGRP